MNWIVVSAPGKGHGWAEWSAWLLVLPGQIHANGGGLATANAMASASAASDSCYRSAAMRFRFGHFELDEQTRSLSSHGRDVAVEPKVLLLISHLVANRCRLVPQSELLAVLWPGVAVSRASIDRLVKEARRVLGDDAQSQLKIVTRRGLGYQFADTVEEVAKPAVSGRRPAFPGTRGAGAADATSTVRESSEESLAIHWLEPAEGYSILTPGSKVRLGRAPTCDIVVASPGLSRTHAEFFEDGPVWAVRDLQSRNGTIIDGRRTELAPLLPNTVVRFADHLGVVRTMQQAQHGRFGELGPGVYGGPVLRLALDQGLRVAQHAGAVAVVGEPGSGRRAVARLVLGRLCPGRPQREVFLSPEASLQSLTALLRDALAPSGSEPHDEARPLLIDDLTDLTLPAQDYLARAVSEHQGKSAPPKLRVTLTSRIPLGEGVAKGCIAESIYQRFDWMELRVPALRERRDDIPPLLRHFLSVSSPDVGFEFKVSSLEHLCLKPWPINVKQLKSFARQLVGSLSRPPRGGPCSVDEGQFMLLANAVG